MAQNENNSSRIVFAAILAIFVYGVIAAMLGVLLASFNLTPAQNGNIALAQAIGMIIASLSAGPIIDRKGKKLALVTSLALIAGSLFLLRSATDYEMQMLWVFVLGLGGGILVTAAISLHFQGEVVWGVPDEARRNYDQLRRRVNTLVGLPTP